MLWLLASFVFFLVPKYLFFNDSALAYGAGYSLLGFGAYSVGSPSTRTVRGEGSKSLQEQVRPYHACDIVGSETPQRSASFG